MLFLCAQRPCGEVISCSRVLSLSPYIETQSVGIPSELKLQRKASAVEGCHKQVSLLIMCNYFSIYAASKANLL
jgi:hypothetical protein